MSIREDIERLAAEMDACEMSGGQGCALQCDLTLISGKIALMEDVCKLAESYEELIRQRELLAAALWDADLCPRGKECPPSGDCIECWLEFVSKRRTLLQEADDE